MRVKVAVEDRVVLRALSQLRSLMTDLRPVFEDIGHALERNVNLRFDTKRDPSGNQWQQWATKTEKARESEGRGTLLEYTGRMRDSLTYTANSTSVEIGFGVDYAKYHEEGRGVPRRQMLLDGDSLGNEDVKDIFDVLMKHLKKAQR